jgi:hypothetical protein
MNKRNTNRSFLLALFLLIGASVGCKMLGGGSNSNTNAGATTRGIPAAKICQVLAQPSFENNSPYNGQSCSGSTHFGARDTRTASYETDTRPSFTYSAIGEQDVVTRVHLFMSKRPDGAEFFASVGDAVAKVINGQPLPDEIRNSIMAQSVGNSVLGPKSTTTSQIGNAKVELIRSTTDDSFDLTFKF